MRKLDRSFANYLLLLYGGLMIIGLLLVIFPQWSLMAVTWLLGFGALISGAISLFLFWKNRKDGGNSLLLFGAVLGIIVGILIMIFRLEIALVILPSLIGVAVVASAALCIMASLRYRELRVSSWWLPLIAGAVALTVAILIFLNLSSTVSLRTRIIGFYCIIFSGIRFGECCTVKKYL